MLYYFGREDPNDAYLRGESWHIVGKEANDAVAFFDTWKRAEEYLNFVNNSQPIQELKK